MKNIKIKDTEFNFINTIIGLFSGFGNGLFGSGGKISKLMHAISLSIYFFPLLTLNSPLNKY